MKSSKMLSLLAATMIGTAVNATDNVDVIEIGDFGVYKYHVEDKNQNILQLLACHCGEEEFEFQANMMIRPFKLIKAMRLTEEEMTEDLFTELFGVKPEKTLEKIEEYLSTRDKDGNTALDILTKRATETNHIDCIAMKEFIEHMSRAIEFRKKIDEALKKETVIKEAEKVEITKIIMS